VADVEAERTHTFILAKHESVGSTEAANEVVARFVVIDA
jgi:hypothetical protein